MSQPKCWNCQHHQKVRVGDEPIYFASQCERGEVFGIECEWFEGLDYDGQSTQVNV